MSAPRVSVGLPVFNGDAFLVEAIESILSQSFGDLELVICDNASTDGTEAICRRYAEVDKRVRFYRNEENYGAAENFGRVFTHSTGEYFRWAAADDRLETRCLERCVEALDTDKGAILAHTDVRIIDPNGQTMLEYRYPPNYAASQDPAERFGDVILLDRWCTEIFALIRTDVLRTTRLMDRFVASDRILRAELALRGRFAVVGEFLFNNRDHPGRSVRAMPSHHMRAGWFDTAQEGKRIFPHWRIFREYFRCIARAPLRARDRRRCYLGTTRWLWIHMNWARLIADVAIAAAPGTWKAFWRLSRASERWLSKGP